MQRITFYTLKALDMRKKAEGLNQHPAWTWQQQSQREGGPAWHASYQNHPRVVPELQSPWNRCGFGRRG